MPYVGFKKVEGEWKRDTNEEAESYRQEREKWVGGRKERSRWDMRKSCRKEIDIETLG